MADVEDDAAEAAAAADAPPHGHGPSAADVDRARRGDRHGSSLHLAGAGGAQVGDQHLGPAAELAGDVAEVDAQAAAAAVDALRLDGDPAFAEDGDVAGISHRHRAAEA